MNHPDPSDEGELPDPLVPIPIPPEVLANAYLNLNLAEIEEEIREVQAGRGLTYEQCVEALSATLDRTSAN